jgi:hypothetical protein
MAPRSEPSAMPSRPGATSGGTPRSPGTARTVHRSGGRSGGGRCPTRKRKARAWTPCSCRRAQSSSARSDSSCAQTLLGTRRRSVPASSDTGCACSAMRAPTALCHSFDGMGLHARANRFSPARRRMASSDSGARRVSRLRMDRSRLVYPLWVSARARSEDVASPRLRAPPDRTAPRVGRSFPREWSHPNAKSQRKNQAWA